MVGQRRFFANTEGEDRTGSNPTSKTSARVNPDDTEWTLCRTARPYYGFRAMDFDGAQR
eukprot:CAMPEP_0172542210 /NCGR_PEP_ID=MMETSP1067-20121228/12877_1 /TAXON_ID=265564 ORGANISM="Thalassiosira punctigera, Strain Tpunct2005C2" /NCGR_SAMPLE_ID=MMETSP1067 /ASSEMBLY_ACC=CAM_ASM_000444 /LENGTH=58 /DNA_ID=CAMNT_0013328399 /DNA_START=300 /DNA_END=476 /DNA_ORIENTATION=+